MACPTLTSNHVGTNPIIISERQCPTLTSDHVVTYPTTLSERPSTHIHSTNDRNGSALTLGHVRNQSSMPKGSGPALTSIQPMIKKVRALTSVQPMIRKGFALTFDTCEEPIQQECSKRHALTFDHVGTNPTIILEWPPVLD